jgi:transcriptional regulator with XRE-family HTH domain
MPKSLRSPRQKYLQDLLLKIRKAKKLTQIDVAERLSRPQSFVAKYEGGERRLDVIEFIEVAQALETDPCVVLVDVLEAEVRSATRSRATRGKQK